MLRIILSGGQTGVDQAALRAAQAANLLCAGWCPPNRACETGAIPDRFPVQPTPVERSEDRPLVERSQRTEWNVRDSDGTLIILNDIDGSGVPHDPGTSWTKEATDKHRRPVYLIRVCDGKANKRAVELWHGVDEEKEVRRVADWVKTQKQEIRVLNVGGPSEKTLPGVGDWTYRFLTKLFSPEHGLVSKN